MVSAKNEMKKTHRNSEPLKLIISYSLMVQVVPLRIRHLPPIFVCCFHVVKVGNIMQDIK